MPCRRAIPIIAWALVLAPLFSTHAAASPLEGPTRIVPLAYHPYPDDADPLGVPYFKMGDSSWDYFQATYSIYDEDRNGFDFPSLVVDGIGFIEGAPGGDYKPTLAAYRDAFEARVGVETPIILTVATVLEDDKVLVQLTVEPKSPLDESALALKWALTEDDVYYKPPPALSNGVDIHRFTARFVSPRPPLFVDLSSGAAVTHATEIALDPSWDRSNLYVAAWLQNEAETSARFQLAEVVQAAIHRADAVEPTVQVERAVLMEMFTATWCPACLFGDSALHRLASDEGLRSTRYHEPTWRYVRDERWEPWAFSVLLGAAMAAVVLPAEGPLRSCRDLTRRWRR